MLGFGALGQLALGEATNSPATTVFEGSWTFPWSDPVKIKPGVLASNQAFFFYQPAPPIIFSPNWFQAWSEPSVKTGISPRLAIALAASGLFSPVIGPIAPGPNYESAWHYRWSEPVRLKPGLRTEYQKFESQDTLFIPPPAALLQGWFNWLTEPVRRKAGLLPQLQQFLAYHPRTLPNPNVTVVINAIETNADIALIAVNVIQSKPPASAIVSIVEVGGNSATSVWEH
jgi:hypothetical protein